MGEGAVKRHIALVLVFGILPSADLYAQQKAGTILKVSARVEAICEITASDLTLGTTAQSTSPRRGTTYLRATCTPDAGYQVALSLGRGASPGTDTVTGVGTGMTQDHTVFGAVPATQVLPAEGSGDAVTVRIYY